MPKKKVLNLEMDSNVEPAHKILRGTVNFYPESEKARVIAHYVANPDATITSTAELFKVEKNTLNSWINKANMKEAIEKKKNEFAERLLDAQMEIAIATQKAYADKLQKLSESGKIDFTPLRDLAYSQDLQFKQMMLMLNKPTENVAVTAKKSFSDFDD